MNVGWTKVCTIADIPEDEGFQFPSVPPIAVFLVNDEVFAIADTCTHGDSSLAGGYLEAGDCQVECAWHMARFDLRTGKALTLPATVAQQTYEVKREGDDIYVDVPDGYLIKDAG